MRRMRWAFLLLLAGITAGAPGTALPEAGAGREVLVLDGEPEAAAVTAEGASPVDSLMLDVGEVLDELLWPEPYLYQSAGLRDPFVPLIGAASATEEGPPAIEEMIVVGVLWGERDRFALVETRGGRNLILRVGDPVRYGQVVQVLPDGLRVSHTLYGVTRTFTLPVRSGVEGER